MGPGDQIGPVNCMGHMGLMGHMRQFVVCGDHAFHCPLPTAHCPLRPRRFRPVRPGLSARGATPGQPPAKTHALSRQFSDTAPATPLQHLCGGGMGFETQRHRGTQRSGGSATQSCQGAFKAGGLTPGGFAAGGTEPAMRKKAAALTASQQGRQGCCCVRSTLCSSSRFDPDGSNDGPAARGGDVIWVRSGLFIRC